jgi:hypothetical protein
MAPAESPPASTRADLPDHHLTRMRGRECDAAGIWRIDSVLGTSLFARPSPSQG